MIAATACPPHLSKDREREEDERGSGSEENVENHRVSIKVLYTPDTPLNRSIMVKANRDFSAPEYFKEWAEQVADCSQLFLDTFPPESSAVQRMSHVCIWGVILLLTYICSILVVKGYVHKSVLMCMSIIERVR